jgi:hypothetical protein
MMRLADLSEPYQPLRRVIPTTVRRLPHEELVMFSFEFGFGARQDGYTLHTEGS